MKKIFLIVILLLCAIAKLYCQDTISLWAYNYPQPISNFEDRDSSNFFYFDTTQLNNLWQIGTPSKSIFNSSYSPTIALVTDTLNAYTNGNISSFEIVVRTDDWTFVSFWHRFNSDSLTDGGTIEVSNDNGSTWTNIINAPGYNLTNFYSNSSTILSNSSKPGFTGNWGWIKSTIHYPGALNYIRFRFTFTSDSTNTNKDGWMIDNFVFECLGTGIDEAEVNSNIRIFPNPTSNFLTIETNKPIEFKSAEIKDVLGKTILSYNQSIIDLSKFETGVYFVEVTTDKGKYVKRIVKN